MIERCHVDRVSDLARAAELAAALRARIRNLPYPLTAAGEREIRQFVCDYADALKDLGVPSERVVIAVKREADDAGVVRSQGHLSNTDPHVGNDRLVDNMVSWCIQRFYETLPRAD